MSRVLVAGVGNIFLGDDGFGPAVAQEIGPPGVWGPDVVVTDFGIRGVHLAYELLNGYDALVLVDAVSRGDPPGTVSVIDASAAAAGVGEGDGVLMAMDAHGMHPGAVLGMVEDLGGRVDQVLVVGCEAGSVEEGIGLSGPVAAAVPAAVAAVRELIGTLVKEATP
jgi:hydrogenase maturation protease